jgi:esterase/lipase
MSVAVTGQDVMEPCYFAAEQRLFGCWHPGRGRRAVVICMSLGHEYQRLHRAGRQLAVQLSRAGIDALRFDYSGSGDSVGDEFTLVQAQQDVCDAIMFAKNKGASVITVIGVRLGAAFAVSAAQTPGVDSLILWEPVLDGGACLEEWMSLQREYEKMMGYSSMTSPPECLGFTYTPELWKSIGAIQLDVLSACVKKQIQIIDGENKLSALVHSLRPQAASVQHVNELMPAIWRRESTDALVPFQTIRAITNWVVGLPA